MEMHLVSERRQRIEVGGMSFAVEEGETIHTENSHKYGRAQIASMVADAGWAVERRWSSQDPAYDLMLLRSKPPAPGEIGVA